MAETATVPMRLPADVVAEASTWGRVLGAKTPGEALAQAWGEYLTRHDEELDSLEDEARARRKAMRR